MLSLAVDEAGREAAARGIGLDREMLKGVVELSLAKHGIAKGGTLREALKKVA